MLVFSFLLVFFSHIFFSSFFSPLFLISSSHTHFSSYDKCCKLLGSWPMFFSCWHLLNASSIEGSSILVACLLFCLIWLLFTSPHSHSPSFVSFVFFVFFLFMTHKLFLLLYFLRTIGIGKAYFDFGCKFSLVDDFMFCDHW
jgi:hypothetical protein